MDWKDVEGAILFGAVLIDGVALGVVGLFMLATVAILLHGGI